VFKSSLSALLAFCAFSRGGVLFAEKRAFVRQARFATFPETLVIHAKKFQLVNWVPTKLGRFLMSIRMFSSITKRKGII
jgi:hypothetical protein